MTTKVQPSKAHLRPIGTEFWHEAGPSATSSDSSNRRFLYRVVAHDKCLRFEGDEVGEFKERLKVVRTQRAPLIGIRAGVAGWPFGNNYVFGEWEDV